MSLAWFNFDFTGDPYQVDTRGGEWERGGKGNGNGNGLESGDTERREMNRHEVGGRNFQSLCHYYIIPLATYRRPTGDLQATNR